MQRQVGNLSLVAGSLACNAKCPFCVARMTPSRGQDTKFDPISRRNLEKAIALAHRLNAFTALITSKGEPTLAPKHIEEYLDALGPISEGRFPIRELQTNGLLFVDPRRKAEYREHLTSWRDKGLSVIALSLVSTEREQNAKIYTPRGDHYDLPEMIRYLHDLGFTVRLSMVMLKGMLDTIERVDKLIDFALEHQVTQLTMRPVARPDDSADEEATGFVIANGLDEENQLRAIEEHLFSSGTQLEILPHGAAVLDVRGQNVCLTNCLTIDPVGDTLRQLIFFPQGQLAYDWTLEGAVLLGADRSVAPKDLVQLSS